METGQVGDRGNVGDTQSKSLGEGPASVSPETGTIRGHSLDVNPGEKLGSAQQVSKYAQGNFPKIGSKQSFRHPFNVSLYQDTPPGIKKTLTKVKNALSLLKNFLFFSTKKQESKAEKQNYAKQAATEQPVKERQPHTEPSVTEPITEHITQPTISEPLTEEQQLNVSKQLLDVLFTVETFQSLHDSKGLTTPEEKINQLTTLTPGMVDFFEKKLLSPTSEKLKKDYPDVDFSKLRDKSKQLLEILSSESSVETKALNLSKLELKETEILVLKELLKPGSSRVKHDEEVTIAIATQKSGKENQMETEFKEVKMKTEFSDAGSIGKLTRSKAKLRASDEKSVRSHLAAHFNEENAPDFRGSILVNFNKLKDKENVSFNQLESAVTSFMGKALSRDQVQYVTGQLTLVLQQDPLPKDLEACKDALKQRVQENNIREEAIEYETFADLIEGNTNAPDSFRKAPEFEDSRIAYINDTWREGTTRTFHFTELNTQKPNQNSRSELERAFAAIDRLFEDPNAQQTINKFLQA